MSIFFSQLIDHYQELLTIICHYEPPLTVIQPEMRIIFGEYVQVVPLSKSKLIENIRETHIFGRRNLRASTGYPLVNSYNYGKSPFFMEEKQLFPLGHFPVRYVSHYQIEGMCILAS